MSALEVSFRYEPGEYARALRSVQMRRLRAKQDAVVALVLLAYGAFLWAREGFHLWVALACGVGALLLLLLGAALFAVPRLVERSQPKLREPYALTFSEAGIHFRSTGVDSRLAWSVYSSWWEDGEFLFLVYGAREATVLPLRALAGDQDRAALRALVTEHVGRA